MVKVGTEKRIKGLISLIKRNPKILTGVVIFVVLLLMGLLEPIIDYLRLGSHSPDEIGLADPYLHWSFKYPLGTDPYGRDLFGMMLVGIRYSLFIGIIAGAIGIVIAVTIGFISGYKGGLVDHILRSITDAFLVIPTWPIFVIIAVYTKAATLLDISLLLAIFSWPGSARTIRAQVLSMKESPYVQLAKVSGESDLEIVFFELMPNLLPYVFIGFSNMIMSAIFAETGLRLIGIGPPMLPTLGYLLNLCITSGFFTSRPVTMIILTLPLILIFVSLNLINIGLDEEFNPRLKKITGL